MVVRGTGLNGRVAIGPCGPGAPYWVLGAVLYLTTARRSRLKVGRILVQWICLLAGVNMGSGVSPWLFCLALDPLLRRLEALGLSYLGAYVDDLSFGARWHQRELLRRAQQVTLAFAAVSGLCVLQHTCASLPLRQGVDTTPLLAQGL